MIKPKTALASLLCCLMSACGGGSSEAATTALPSPLPPPPVSLPDGWTRLADMPAAAAKFGVAAVAGKLYVVGGYDTRRTLMIYDIAANSWVSGPALPQGSDNLAALAGDNKVYALGGEAGTAVQVYDPVTNLWAAGPALPGLRFASAAALLNSRLHLVGGWNGSNGASASLASQAVFDLASQTWTAGPPLATARNAAAAAVVDGRMYVVGGRSPGIRATDQQSLASVEVYSSVSGQWTAGAALPQARASLAAVALAGRVYALGGESSGGAVSDAVTRYDPATQAWTALPAMPYRSHGLGAVVVGGAIYVMGGFGAASDAVGSESAAVYRYVPVN